jgi:hypothetical protein
MGSRGPVPSRKAELARPRSRKGREHADPVTTGEWREPVIPDPDPSWHPIARTLWDALSTSGQSDYYQSSDWAFAYSICEDLSYYKRSKKRSGQMLASLYSAMSSLLITEGDRRRVRIELERPAEDEAESASVVAIAEYKQMLGVG